MMLNNSAAGIAFSSTRSAEALQSLLLVRCDLALTLPNTKKMKWRWRFPNGRHHPPRRTTGDFNIVTLSF